MLITGEQHHNVDAGDGADHIEHHADADAGAGDDADHNAVAQSTAPSVTDNVDRLRWCAAALRAGDIGPQDAADLIDALLNGEAGPLKPRPGQRTYRTIQNIKRRDALLKEAAAKFFPGQHVSQPAFRLASDLAHYHATAWQRDRLCPECPAQYADKLRVLLFQILKCIDAPPSGRTIRRILAGS